MKNLFASFCLLGLMALQTPAATVLVENFNYPDGALTNVAPNVWFTHSGTGGQVDVAGEKINVSDSESEDVNRALAGGPYGSASTDILYASFVVNFRKLPSATGSYFAHFKDATTSGFRARVFALTTGAAEGTFRLGIGAAGSAPSATLAIDLSLNTNYKVVIRYAPATAESKIWVNPSAEGDPVATSTDAQTSLNISTFAFRQAAGIGAMTVDDLIVGTSFADVVSVSANVPPAITGQPQSQTVNEGATATLSVQASGTPPLSYQWKLNGGAIAGATSSSYVISNAAQAHAGSYTVTVTNQFGTATSEPAVLTVQAGVTPPAITADPATQDVIEGGTATFRVTATGGEPLRYEWKFNGAIISGATNATLVLTNVTAAQAGAYHVVVSNSGGSATSASASLNVRPALSIRPIAEAKATVDHFSNSNNSPTDEIFAVEGVVVTRINLTTPQHSLFYIQDASAGIAVFWNGAGSTNTPAFGDKVRVIAPLEHFNGLLELVPRFTNSLHSVRVLSANNPIPAPTALQFSWQVDPDLMEQHEGKHVVVSNVFLDLTSPTFRTGGENVNLTNDLGETFVLRVDSRTDMAGQSKPTGPVTIFGVLGQFDTSNPRTEGYQIIPSRLADIVSAFQAPPVYFVNVLENLIRPGDAPTNTFSENVVRPGEKLTIRVAITNDVEVNVLASAGLPASAQWNFSATRGTNITGTFTFAPTAADAGVSVNAGLQVYNSRGTNAPVWKVYVPTAAEQQVIVGEFLANPTSTATAAHFNPLRRAEPAPAPNSDDEYIELVNLSGQDINLVNWTVADSVQVRLRFYNDFMLQSSNAVVVYGGPLNGFTPGLDVPTSPATEGDSTGFIGLGLNNNGDTILVRNASSNLIARVIYTTEMLSSDGSLARHPNLNGAFAAHATLGTNVVSPGKQFNGRPFSEPAAGEHPPIRVSIAKGTGGQVLLTWNSQPGSAYSVLQADAVTGPYAVAASGLTQGQHAVNASAGNRFFRVTSP